MSNTGTLLTDLSSTPSSDGDLVNKIMADMNLQQGTPTHEMSQPMHSMIPSSPQMISNPNPNTTIQKSIDPSIPNTHLIGKNYPSPSDFAELMRNSTSYTEVPAQTTTVSTGTMKGLQYFINQFKQPIIVMIIIFIMNITAFNVIISHYIPSLISSTGEFTTIGTLFKSLVGGLLFWFFQNVVSPLLSA